MLCHGRAKTRNPAPTEPTCSRGGRTEEVSPDREEAETQTQTQTQTEKETAAETESGARTPGWQRQRSPRLRPSPVRPPTAGGAQQGGGREREEERELRGPWAPPSAPARKLPRDRAQAPRPRKPCGVCARTSHPWGLPGYRSGGMPGFVKGLGLSLSALREALGLFGPGLVSSSLTTNLSGFLAFSTNGREAVRHFFLVILPDFLGAHYGSTTI